MALVKEYELVSDLEGVERALGHLSGYSECGLDVETTGLDPYTSELLLVQIASPERTFVFDARRAPIERLGALLEDPSVVKIAHNAKFEYEMLRMRGIKTGPLADTMLAERVLTAGGEGKHEIALKPVAMKYLGVELKKEERKGFYSGLGGDDAYLAPSKLEYAAVDAEVLLPIWAQQEAAIEADGSKRVLRLEHRVLPCVAEMELAGCLVDPVAWRRVLAGAALERDEIARELAHLFAPVVAQTSMFEEVCALNFKSQPQVLRAFQDLGIELSDTQEATLKKHMSGHPAVAKLLEFREKEKQLSTYGESLLALINPATGRIHADYNQLGADSGRFSCSKPNLQNLPATSAFRSCFVAPEGSSLVIFDYSQQELRILAELSGEPVYIEAFKSGADLHRVAASMIFGVSIDAVTKAQRRIAKTLQFAVLYGRGAESLAADLGISVVEAREVIKKYFAAYKEVAAWRENAKWAIVRNCVAETSLGRKRRFYPPDPEMQRTDEEGYRREVSSIQRQGVNHLVQAAAADMTKLALFFVTEALRDHHAKVINAVHDELVVECPDDEAGEVKEIVGAQMVRAGEYFLKSVPIAAEGTIGKVWSKE
jgi:DNA polymerase-1